MPTLTKSMARGSFTTELQDLYVVPTSETTAIVTNIVIVNTTAASATFSLLLDGVDLFTSTPMDGNSTISVDLKQVLDPNGTPKKITGFASLTTVRYHISGIEIS
jgi:hypothetical protein